MAPGRAGRADKKKRGRSGRPFGFGLQPYFLLKLPNAAFFEHDSLLTASFFSPAAPAAGFSSPVPRPPLNLATGLTTVYA